MATRFVNVGVDTTAAGENVAGFCVNSSGELALNVDGVNDIHPTRESLTFLVTATSVDSVVFVAPQRMQLVGIRHVVSTGAAAATLVVRKCTGTTAPAAGDAMHSGSLDLNATANTSTTTAVTTTVANAQLAAGDRIAFDFSGTLTGLVGAVTLEIRRGF